MLLCKRLLCTTDYLLGLPPSTPPREFTRRVLLRKAYLRCALSAVSRDRPPPPPSAREVSSFDTAGLDDPLPSWCRHRVDLRLVDSEITIKRNIIDAGVVSGGTDASVELPPIHASSSDEGKRHGSPSVPAAEGDHEGRISTTPCSDDQEQRLFSSSAGWDANSCGDATERSPSGRDDFLLQDCAAHEDSEIVMTAHLMEILAPSSPHLLTEDEDDNNQEREDERADVPTTSKLITIDSLTYRKGLTWVPRSYPESSCGKESPAAGEGEMAEGQILPAQLLEGLLQSQMNFELRARHIALSLPPKYQLGNLHVAALLQWKGIQAALGECWVVLRGYWETSVASFVRT